MSRILFVVPPLAAHVNPTVGVAVELRRRGHTVAWAGHSDLIGEMLPAGSQILDVLADAQQRTEFHDWFVGLETRRGSMRGAAAFRFLWEEFLLPLSESMFAGVERAIADFGADLLAVDQHVFAGAIAAEKHRIPWCTMAIMSAEIVDPLSPPLREWIRDRQRSLCNRLGEQPGPHIDDLRFSPHLVVAFTSAALIGELDRYPAHYRFVGPSLYPRGGEFDWEWLDPDRRHVLITLGTVSVAVGGAFLRAAVEAVAGFDDVQAVIVDRGGAVGAVPPNVRPVGWVPYLELLPMLDAVVCHGGHTTTCEALAYGVPLVLAPIRDDHPITAAQVETAGAGTRLRFGRARAADIGAALRQVLDDSSFRVSAGRVRESFVAAGGARAAADQLEQWS